MAERPLTVLARGLPGPARVVVGAVAVVAGLLLVTRPLVSLSVLALYVAASCVAAGLGALAGTGHAATRVAGAGWLLLGAVLLALPGHAVGVLPLVVGGGLVASGALRLLAVRRGGGDARATGLLLGLSELVLGLVALAWPDVTLVLAAGLFGVHLVVVGATLLVDAALGRSRPLAPERPVRRRARLVSAALALALSLGALVVSERLRHGVIAVDDFYTAPQHVPAEPGVLLRSEPFGREVPAGARGSRILYTTTDTLGRPTLASALVVLPAGTAATGRPVVAWAHGTTGYARQCAPSLLAEPFTAGAFPAVLDDVVDRGWAVVATDYAGLGTAGPQPYLIGPGSARSVLDAVRAARSLDGAGLDPERTVVWGHSQGGGAALWTAQEQRDYAPDVPLAGTVAMAPAIDPLALAEGLAEIPGGTLLGSFVFQAYAETYPDLALADFVSAPAIPLVEGLAARCLTEPGILASLLTALALGHQDVLSIDPATGPVGARLRANVARAPGPGPLLVAQGGADVLVTPAATDAYVARLRRAGHRVDHPHLPRPGAHAAGRGRLPAAGRVAGVDRRATGGVGHGRVGQDEPGPGRRAPARALRAGALRPVRRAAGAGTARGGSPRRWGGAPRREHRRQRPGEDHDHRGATQDVAGHGPVGQGQHHAQQAQERGGDRRTACPGQGGAVAELPPLVGGEGGPDPQAHRAVAGQPAVGGPGGRRPDDRRHQHGGAAQDQSTDGGLVHAPSLGGQNFCSSSPLSTW